jgi:hypothetical protein
MLRSKSTITGVLLICLTLLCAHPVSAVQASFIIRAVAGLHGTISPHGWAKINAGASQTFVMQPDDGYEIADVTVDHVSQGILSSYTFSNVSAHHRIVATFKKTNSENQTEFHSALPHTGRMYGGGGAPGGVDEGKGNDNKRTIEEGDVVKVHENTLYVLNQYRGLQIIDITDSASASLVSAVPLYGYPVELYVRGTNAYVVISNYFN